MRWISRKLEETAELTGTCCNCDGKAYTTDVMSSDLGGPAEQCDSQVVSVQGDAGMFLNFQSLGSRVTPHLSRNWKTITGFKIINAHPVDHGHCARREERVTSDQNRSDQHEKGKPPDYLDGITTFSLQASHKIVADQMWQTSQSRISVKLRGTLCVLLRLCH